jgi:hypothetical protein
MIAEEYGPEIRYIQAEHNVVADALSRLEKLPNDVTPDGISVPPGGPTPAAEAATECLATCYASKLIVDGKLPDGCYPLRFARIQHHQLKDRSLRENTLYSLQAFHGGKNSKFQLYADKMGKVAIPKSLQKQCWQWYHDYLVHPGFDRTYQSIADAYTWVGMHGMTKEWCRSCDRCQRCKTTYRQYGLLPPKQAEEIPWECLCVDCIGPYTFRWYAEGVSKKDHEKVVLRCVTMIDPATGWFEIAEVPDFKAFPDTKAVEKTWLTRYPWPSIVQFDHGSEFKEAFNDLVETYQLIPRPSTARNPQANSILEEAGPSLDPDKTLKECGIICNKAEAIWNTMTTAAAAPISAIQFKKDLGDFQGYAKAVHRLDRMKQDKAIASVAMHLEVIGAVIFEKYEHDMDRVAELKRAFDLAKGMPNFDFDHHEALMEIATLCGQLEVRHTATTKTCCTRNQIYEQMAKITKQASTSKQAAAQKVDSDDDSHTTVGGDDAHDEDFLSPQEEDSEDEEDVPPAKNKKQQACPPSAKKRKKHTRPAKKKQKQYTKPRHVGDPPRSIAEPMDVKVRAKLEGIAEPMMNTHKVTVPLLQADSFEEGQLDAETIANQERFAVVAQGAFFFTNQKRNGNGGGFGGWRAKGELHIWLGAMSYADYLENNVFTKMEDKLDVIYHFSWESFVTVIEDPDLRVIDEPKKPKRPRKKQPKSGRHAGSRPTKMEHRVDALSRTKLKGIIGPMKSTPRKCPLHPVGLTTQKQGKA